MVRDVPVIEERMGSQPSNRSVQIPFTRGVDVLTQVSTNIRESIARTEERNAERAQQNADAMVKVHDLEVRNLAADAIQKFEIRHSADPSGLSQAIDEYSRELLGGVMDPVRTAELQFEIDTQKRAAVTRAVKNQSQVLDTQAELQSRKTMARLLKENETLAPSLFADDEALRESAAMRVNQNLLQMTEALSIKRTNGKTVFSAEQMLSEALEAADAVYSSGLKAWFNTQEDRIGAFNELKDYKDGYSQLLSPAAHDKLIADLSKQIRDEQLSVRAGYKKIVEAMDDGIIPSIDSVQQIRNQAQSLNMPDVIQSLDVKMEVRESLKGFVAQPIEKQIELLNEARTNASFLDDKGLEQFREFSAALKAKQQAVEGDNALEYYAKVGIIEPVMPILPENPASILEALPSRVSARNEIFAHDGVIVPIITKNEAQAMVDFYKRLPIADKNQYVMQLSFVGDEYLPMIGDVLSKATGNRDQHASVGALASVARGAPLLVEEAVSGAETERFFSEKDLRLVVREKLSNAVLDEGALQDMTSFIGDVYAYRVRALSKDKQSDIDESVLNKIQENAFGPVLDVNSSKVLPFRQKSGNFIDEDDFEDLLESLSVNTLPKIPYLNGRPITQEEFQDMLDDYRLVTVGDGLYEVRSPYNNLLVLSDENGSPIELDLKSLDAKTITRNP